MTFPIYDGLCIKALGEIPSTWTSISNTCSDWESPDDGSTLWQLIDSLNMPNSWTDAFSVARTKTKWRPIVVVWLFHRCMWLQQQDPDLIGLCKVQEQLEHGPNCQCFSSMIGRRTSVWHLTQGYCHISGTNSGELLYLLLVSTMSLNGDTVCGCVCHGYCIHWSWTARRRGIRCNIQDLWFLCEPCQREMIDWPTKDIWKHKHCFQDKTKQWKTYYTHR